MDDRPQPGRYIDNRADEVHRDAVATTTAHDIVPQLPAFSLPPAIGALVNGDDELRGFFQEVKQLGFGGFHGTTLYLHDNYLLRRYCIICMRHMNRTRIVLFVLGLVWLTPQTKRRWIDDPYPRPQS